MFCSLLYLLLMESRWPTLEHSLASLCSSAYPRGGSILIVTQGPICEEIRKLKSLSDKLQFYFRMYHYDNIYLHINVEWTVGFNWNTWLLTAKLCSNLNGGNIIPSLTGNVNRSSSSENKNYVLMDLFKYIRVCYSKNYILSKTYFACPLLVWARWSGVSHRHSGWCKGAYCWQA